MFKDKNNFNSLCMECKEEIFNPICPSCLSQEMRDWLAGKSKKVFSIVEQELSKIMLSKTNKKGCLKCSSDLFLCPYCFTERIYLRLKKEKAPKEILREFLTFFNYDLEHTGYSKDMESLGLI
jgi:hypothetical protein